jgi:hypothetical protein
VMRSKARRSAKRPGAVTIAGLWFLFTPAEHCWA